MVLILELEKKHIDAKSTGQGYHRVKVQSSRQISPNIPCGYWTNIREQIICCRHEARIRRNARTSKQKMDLDYGIAGYDFRTLIMAHE